jgi:hypothetical protein
MLKQKEEYIPQVTTASAIVDVTLWSAATSFTTEAIEFPSNAAWVLGIPEWEPAVVGAPLLTILHCNTRDGEYSPYSTLATSINITSSVNRMIYDDIFPARYMKIQYVSGGATGTFSLVLSK